MKCRIIGVAVCHSLVVQHFVTGYQTAAEDGHLTQAHLRVRSPMTRSLVGRDCNAPVRQDA